MKIAVMGLGNIAQKAYLPVMASMQHEVEWILCSRDEGKRQQLAAKYGFAPGVATVEEVCAAGVDGCFIHTPTPTHVVLIEQLLNNKVAVYVDKPISEDASEVARLQAIAAAQNVPLMVGFNRRYAPYIAQLKTTTKRQIIAQKHRIQSTNTVRFGLFDLVIHPLDSAVYLFDSPPHLAYSSVEATGERLDSVFAHLKSDTQEAFVSVNLQAGVNEERLEIRSPEASIEVLDLTQLTIKTATGQRTNVFGDWEPTLEKRGFAPIIREFIKIVAAGQQDIKSSALDLLSHQLCEQIYQNYLKKT